jgi:hypothetical protein
LTGKPNRLLNAFGIRQNLVVIVVALLTTTSDEKDTEEGE